MPPSQDSYPTTKGRPALGIVVIAVAILLSGLFIAGAIYLSAGKRQAASSALSKTEQAPSVAAADINKVKTAGNPFVGNPEAPIVLAYWLDYQCPFCRMFETQSMPLLYEEYIKTGKVKLIYKDFQFLGADSQTLGKFARAVWEIAPDKFYAWHKSMYENQGQENTGWATQETIMRLTTQALGESDAAKVLALVQSKGDQYQKQMDADKAEGATFGVSGTPSFIAGKRLVVGAQPYSTIKQLIDTASQ